jgi:hypothetical protein
MDVHELTSREQIRDAGLRYCRGLDHCDASLAETAYWSDAIDEHGTFVGSGHEFVRYAVDRLRAGYDATQHLVSNHSIEVDGDSATGEMYVIAAHRKGEMVHTWWGRYLDRYECRDGQWRISHRVCVHEWTVAGAIVERMPIRAELFRQGSDDRRTD